MAYRFVHAADIHLDSPLRSLALRDPDLAALVGNATRRAFVGIVDLCLAEQVDALLLAGDLYDGDQTSMKTARFLAEQVKRLHLAGIATFMIRGNHDALSRITKELVFPESVTLFGGRADAIAVPRAPGALPITIHGLSFAQPHAPESLLPRYRPPSDGAVNIALMHTSLVGDFGHDLYAPCSVSDLQGSGHHYWALGHVHKRAIVERGGAIVMPGMPQGRDINEAGAKSVTIVTIADDRSIHIAEHRTSVAQFERITVDVTGIAAWSDLIEAVGRGIEGARASVVSEHLVARLRLTGSTPLAWRILNDRDLLKTEADLRAAATGRSWIEKIEIDCSAPGAIAGLTRLAADPVIELRRLIDEAIIGSATYKAEVDAIANELRAQLPPDCRAILGTDDLAFQSAVADLVRQGADDVMARLHAEPDGADAV